LTSADPALRDIEQNVILRFSKAFESRFPSVDPSEATSAWVNSSFGAQDEFFADHLLAANARFALIEFKASFLAIRKEAGKPLRKVLFTQLVLRGDFLRRCLDFHYVCWGTIRRHHPAGLPFPINEEIDLLNQYAFHVAPFMKTTLQVDQSPDISTNTFLDGFINSRLIGGTYSRFKRYLDELGQLVDGAKAGASSISGMVCIYVPASGDEPARHAYKRFNGLDSLQLLLQPKAREPSHEHEHEMEISSQKHSFSGPTMD
jgi:hypothetical protein